MKYLFVCIENAGRSQMAEGFGKKYGLDCESAGTFPGDRINNTAGEQTTIDPGPNSIVRIISGRGTYTTGEPHKYLYQDVIQLKSNTKFEPIENTRLEIISM